MSELSVEARQKILQLKQDYLASFPEKVRQLQACWQNLESKKITTNELNSLGALLHKIAGSAGFHELYDIHSAAHSAELICKNAELSDMGSPGFVADLKSSYEKLIELMQEPA